MSDSVSVCLKEASMSELGCMVSGIDGYHYSGGGPTEAHAYLLPVFFSLLEKHLRPGADVFEIGAGNGYTANEVARRGYRVVGIDPSAEGARIAVEHYPRANIIQASIYGDLSGHEGRYDFVYSLEVIEHIYAPRELVRKSWGLLRPGGSLCISTPFHGYWKNLALAAAGKLDDHFTALWDHGHIKFLSQKTLNALLNEQGFAILEHRFAGRFYPLSKSIIVVAGKAN
jgi:2-polyprenyl-3-methyl-5-hydroxy-6-metoxy-1,4-benzoquinol methylase